MHRRSADESRDFGRRLVISSVCDLILVSPVLLLLLLLLGDVVALMLRLVVVVVVSDWRAGAGLEVRLEVALAAEGLLAALALEGVHVHVEVVWKEIIRKKGDN